MPSSRAEPKCHLHRLVVADRLHVIDLLGRPVRHHHPGPALDDEGAALSAGDRRRARRLVRLDEDAVRPERVRDAQDRARRSHAVAERGHPACGLLPDLAAETVAVVGDDVRVVELVGRVVARRACELGGSRDHVLDVLRGHLRTALDRRNDVDLRPERAHELKALLGEAVGHHDQGSVALGLADECERRAGAAARVLDDGVARGEQPVAFCSLDHRERHPVLHRSARVAVLELQPELRAVRRRAAMHADEWRVPDRLEDRLHAVTIRLSLLPVQATTRPNARRPGRWLPQPRGGGRRAHRAGRRG